MIKTTKLLTILLVALFALFSCKPDPTLSVSISALNVADAQSETMFAITSNSAWTITGTTDWCTVTQTTGDGTANVGIQVSANTSKVERTTTLTIVAATLSSTITVTQKQDDALILTKSIENLDCTAHTLAVNLRSNITYDIIMPTGVTWITEVKSKSFESYTHNFLIATNSDYDPRSASIIFKDHNSQLADTLVINQAKLNGLIISNPDQNLNSDGGAVDVELRANVTYDIIIPSTSGWITLITAKGLLTYNHQLLVSKNETFNNREGIVIFKDQNSTLADTLTVKQSAKDGLIITDQVVNFGSEGGNFTVELRANVTYDVIMESGVTWVSQVNTKALTLYNHQFSVSRNDTYDNRSMKVIFKDRNSTLADTLVVNQTQKNGLILTDNEVNLESNGGIVDVELRSNVSYDILLPAGISWVTQVETKALNTYNHQFNVASNTTYDSRSSQIIFKDKNSTLADTLTINQGQFRAVILSGKTQVVPTEGGTFTTQLSSSVSYEVSIVQGSGWISEVTTKALNNYTHEFSATQNNTLDARVGKIVFKDKNSTLADTLTVTQEKTGVLLTSEEDFYIPKAGGTCNFTLFTNVDYGITIKDGEGWITQLETKSFNSKQYSFIITANSTSHDRLGQIIFTALSGNGADTIDIKQSAYNGGYIYLTPSKNIEYLFSEADRATITRLKIEGYVRASDFTFFRESLPLLEELDLSEATVENNAIPTGAFKTISPAIRPLKALIMPSTITSIGAEAFYNCANLLDPTFPTGLTSIGDYAYAGCSLLTSITIPAGVTSIGGYAFSSCPILAYVRSMIAAPFEVNNAFLGISAHADLEVNSGKQVIYENTVGWGYTFFKRIYETGIDPDATITLSREALSAIGKESTGSVNVTTTAAWTILSKPEWVSTSTNGATGNASVSLVFGANTDDGAAIRTGNVIFKITGTSTKDTLVITQYTNKFADGDYDTRQTHSVGNGIDIVFVADGFILDEIVSGEYDLVMNQAITNFFDIEPYTTYRNYFDVRVVYAYSTESGYSDLLNTKNTALSVKYTGITGQTAMSADDDACFTYAESVPDVNLKETVIVVVPNSTRYGGTCWMYSTGEAYAICPISNSAYPYDFRGVVQHEAGGHGFGGLADEYVNNDEGTIPTEEKTSVQTWQALGFFKNIDFTATLTSILWSHFVGLTNYSYVGAHEGAYYYGFGVWRPENTSCMVDNIRYYNAPCSKPRDDCEEDYGAFWWDIFIYRIPGKGCDATHSSNKGWCNRLRQEQGSC